MSRRPRSCPTSDSPSWPPVAATTSGLKSAGDAPPPARLPSARARPPCQPDATPTTRLPSPNRPSCCRLSRNPARGDVPARPTARLTGLDRLLKLAAARGAEALFLFSQSRPSIRVDGEIHALEGEPVLGAAGRRRADARSASRAARRGPAVGQRVDLRRQGRRPRALPVVPRPPGPGGIFRMIPARVASADQLGLSREIQALVRRTGGADPGHRPARQRQVHAAGGVRRSGQPHARRVRRSRSRRA